MSTPSSSASAGSATPAGRYPQRRSPALVILVSAVAAVGLAWLLWAALVQSQPEVGGRVSVWKVNSDREAAFTLTVDRPDPSIPVGCRVIAQAANFEIVGERTVRVGASESKVVDIRESMRTIRRATSVSLDQCWVE